MPEGTRKGNITAVFTKARENTVNFRLESLTSVLGKYWNNQCWRIFPGTWRTRRSLRVVSMDSQRGSHQPDNLLWGNGWFGRWGGAEVHIVYLDFRKAFQHWLLWDPCREADEIWARCQTVRKIENCWMARPTGCWWVEQSPVGGQWSTPGVLVNIFITDLGDRVPLAVHWWCKIERSSL